MKIIYLDVKISEISPKVKLVYDALLILVFY